MGDWFRSVTVLVIAFVGAVVVTIGLANVVVPDEAVDAPAAGGGGEPVTSADAAPPPTGIGGQLVVTGDLEGTMTLTQEANEERYSLVGGDSRIVFEGQPTAIVQISWEGLNFLPEPSDCTITPGELDHQTGIGHAEIRCEGLRAVRDGETIDMAGTIGVALTLVGESELPEMGGSVRVGDETWEFAEAFLFTSRFNSGPGTEGFNLELLDEGRGSLRFTYDVQTHHLGLVSVQRDGAVSELPAGSCNLASDELGRLTPTAAIVELTIECPTVEVPGLGPVPISGTVIVQRLDF